MPITQAAFLRAAQQVSDYLRQSLSAGRRPEHRRIEKYLYELITHRINEDEAIQICDAYYRMKEPFYGATLRSLNFNATIPIHKKSDGFWFSVSYHSLDNFPLIGMYKVKYKEYFTFTSTSRDADGCFTDALNFVRLLPVLHEQLYNLTAGGTYHIAIKIPANFYLLLLSIDSLIIHYSRSELGPSIRNTVLKIFHHYGLILGERSVRVDTAFDFKHTKINILAFSHSEIVANLVAREIVHYASIYKDYTLSQLAALLEVRIRDVSYWPVEKVYDALGDINI